MNLSYCSAILVNEKTYEAKYLTKLQKYNSFKFSKECLGSFYKIVSKEECIADCPYQRLVPVLQKVWFEQ